jgi:hypothetical protein
MHFSDQSAIPCKLLKLARQNALGYPLDALFKRLYSQGLSMFTRYRIGIFNRPQFCTAHNPPAYEKSFRSR